jgi:hypothetical protein
MKQRRAVQVQADVDCGCIAGMQRLSADLQL